MFDRIKSYFSSENKEEITAQELFKDKHIPKVTNEACKDCVLKGHGCVGKLIKSTDKLTSKEAANAEKCILDSEIQNYNPDKDTFFIIDDNEGMVSFLNDDMNYLEEQGVFSKEDINIISLSGSYAAFALDILQKRHQGLNIKWAIIDITLGGSIMTPEGNVKYNGVDVLSMILEYNPELEYIFYTGNNLNPYIKRNKELIDRFNEMTNKDIMDNVLFKTSRSIEDRRRFIAKRFFNKEI
jgi:hypothetical protein